MTVELIDETMIALARTIPLFKSTVEDYVKGNPAAILVVEFAEESWSENLSKVKQLKEIMVSIISKDKSENLKESGIDQGVVVIEPSSEQNRISEMRKSGLNIMMSMKSEAKPVSFVEDCAVPLRTWRSIHMDLQIYLKNMGRMELGTLMHLLVVCMFDQF
ncbi:MAG: hypothetical protein CM15mP54_19870 [Paracoccaceae bacterium]|nr:MAG: hypothetical protein CM15mP54_19870 [Paracoccaceae bacterium]